jgi:hypothetical protein
MEARPLKNTVAGAPQMGHHHEQVLLAVYTFLLPTRATQFRHHNGKNEVATENHEN